MLVAKHVGPTGEVVGVERDANTLTKARSRVAEAQLRNVSFVEADVGQVASSKQRSKPFDAVVGRLILEYVSDPAAVLRSLSNLVTLEASLSFRIVTGLHCFSEPQVFRCGRSVFH
jgi:ubiquinone/menaquinone biosynthesis C-methylase UbiE